MSQFSLVLGGPLFQLFRRTGMAGPSLEFLWRRILSVTAITWMPLLVISLLEGNGWPGSVVRMPFLYDIDTHVRFLLALPILLAAEILIHRRLGPLLNEFVERDIVGEASRTKFDAALAGATRMRDSFPMELALFVVIYTAGHLAWEARIAISSGTWYGTPGADGFQHTWAGLWYAWVSYPLFQFVLFRWAYRIIVWTILLVRIARLDLRLVPTHPDQAGGIGFMGLSIFAWIPFLIAYGASISGRIANRIFFGEAELMSFKSEIGITVLIALVLILGPLVAFSPRLWDARRKGLLEYGTLGSRYVREFDEKWLRNPAGDEILGTGDIQSLADLGNSFQGVRKMRPAVFGLEIILRVVLVTALPILPLLLTTFPLDQLLSRLVKLLI